MEVQITNKEVLERLMKLQADIDFIKKNLIDADCILSPEENERLDTSLEEYDRGEIFSLEDIEKKRTKNV